MPRQAADALPQETAGSGAGVMTKHPVRGSRLACLLTSAASVALLATPTPSIAQAVYRCEHGGRVTYTDVPCGRPSIQDGKSAAAAANLGGGQAVVVGGYENPYGPWRGQAQYQVRNAGLRNDGTHSVVPLVLEISEDGRLAGSSPEIGCRVLGLASPGYTPKMLNLDVTLSNCAARDMNQRYRGSLIINSKERTGRLTLNAQRIGIGTAVIADIQAVLRR